jgi:hypothetical protein
MGVAAMKRLCIITFLVCLLIALFYSYGLSVEKYRIDAQPTRIEAEARIPDTK